MLFFILAAVLLVIGIPLMRSYYHEVKGVMLILCATLILLFALLCMGVNHYAFRYTYPARYKALEMSAELSEIDRATRYQEVVSYNRGVLERRALNDSLWFGLLIPDALLSKLELIEK